MRGLGKDCVQSRSEIGPTGAINTVVVSPSLMCKITERKIDQAPKMVFLQ